MAAEETFLNALEYFMDSDSDEEEFHGFELEGLNRNGATEVGGNHVNRDSDSDSDSEDDFPAGEPSGYDHPWLKDFDEVCGPFLDQDDISERGLFDLFLSDDVLVETNR